MATQTVDYICRYGPQADEPDLQQLIENSVPQTGLAEQAVPQTGPVGQGVPRLDQDCSRFLIRNMLLKRCVCHLISPFFGLVKLYCRSPKY